MKNFKIKTKKVFTNSNQEAHSVNITISYTVGDMYAKGFHEYLSEKGELILSGNENISVENWGLDDTIIEERYLSILKCEKLDT